MIQELILELNKNLGFSMSLESRQDEWNRDEVIKIVSRDVISLTSVDIHTVERLCKAYSFKVIKWHLDTGVVKSNSGFGASYIAGRKLINILMLYIRPIFKWEQKFDGAS